MFFGGDFTCEMLKTGVPVNVACELFQPKGKTELTLIEKEGKTENDKVASPESAPIHLNQRGGRVVRWSWVNFQCRGVLQFG